MARSTERGANDKDKDNNDGKKKEKQHKLFSTDSDKNPMFNANFQVKSTQILSSYLVIKYTARTCQTRQKGSSSNTKWVNTR